MSKKEKKVHDIRQVSVAKALVKGDIFTKMSAIIMGLGNIVRGQIIKGLLFLAMEIGFIFFMMGSGVEFLRGFITLGTESGGEVFNEAKQIYEYTQGDNSMLCLLYGVFTIFIITMFIVVWMGALKSSYEAFLCKKAGKKVPKFIDDVRALFDKNIHKTLLTLPIICVIIFTIMPLVFMISMAFTNYDRNHQPPGKLFDWVGLANFKKIFDYYYQKY